MKDLLSMVFSSITLLASNQIIAAMNLLWSRNYHYSVTAYLTHNIHQCNQKALSNYRVSHRNLNKRRNILLCQLLTSQSSIKVFHWLQITPHIVNICGVIWSCLCTCYAKYVRWACCHCITANALHWTKLIPANILFRKRFNSHRPNLYMPSNRMCSISLWPASNWFPFFLPILWTLSFVFHLVLQLRGTHTKRKNQ